MSLLPQNIWMNVAIVAAVLVAAAGTAVAQQLVNDVIVQGNFLGINQIGTGIGNITQMAFGPDGKLYVSTFTSGIRRYDYDPAGNLTNGVTVWSRPDDPFGTGQRNGSLGVAFHEDPTLGTVMYIAPAVTSDFVVSRNRIQSIVRLTDNDADGKWGESGEVNQAIVDNLRVTDLHQVNQLLVDGDTLYAGIGSRTRTGGEFGEYSGVPNTDDGEFAYTGSINWIRDLTQLSGDTQTQNLAGFAISQHHTDTQAFASADTGKLTVYSTGFRNVYGLAKDTEGQLWATMNQNENPLKPDELHRSDFQDDHKFPKVNEVSGDWKQNPDAIAAGFFETFKDPVATLGNHASANGLDFTDINGAFAGHAFVARTFQGNDLIAIDPDTGAVRQIATGLGSPIDVLTDPLGNLLVGSHGSGVISRIVVKPGPGLRYGDFGDDGIISYDDWITLRENFNQNMSGLTALEAYYFGDLNGDFRNDELDFALFKEAYENANGVGSFARMRQVPEPVVAASLTWLVAMIAMSRRRDFCD